MATTHLGPGSSPPHEGGSAFAAAPAPSHEVWRFGTFELIPGERRLLDGGASVSLRSRAFDLLVALVSRAGELVTKEQLLERVWPGLVVEENNLQVQVSALRKIVGQDAIATIAGHGYRFELPVERSAPVAAKRHVAIPQPLSSLVGRTAEIAAIGSLFEAHRLVTLKGAGGIGKTRLAIAVGHDLARHGQLDIWFVDLSALHDGAALPAAILASIDALRDAQASSLESLQRWLREHPATLILDNCEQIVESVALACRALLEACPGLKLLCTSREALRIGGEAVFTVPPLPEAQAYTLFIERARDVAPALHDSPETRSLAGTIIGRLDGISLALELAAARLRGMSLRELAAQIDDRFQVLTGGDRTALPRHQALRATMEWSYQLLAGPEQQLLRRLAVVHGPFGLDEVAAVAADEGMGRARILDLVTALVDKSLVQAAPDVQEQGYSIFESTRAFARDELERAGELERIQGHHFGYFAGQARLAREAHETVEWPSWRDRLRSVHSNLTAALRWSLVDGRDIEGGAAMAANLLFFWNDFTLLEEAQRYLLLAHQHISRLTPLTAARVLHALGGVYQDLGQYDDSERILRESVSRYAALEDCREEWAIAANELGITLLYRKDYAGARRMYESALPIFRASGNRHFEGRILQNLAVNHLFLDETAEAEEMLNRAIKIHCEAGNVKSEATSLHWLAECAFQRGSPVEALEAANRALELLRPLSGTMIHAVFQYRRAKYAAAKGNFDLASSSMLESLRIISIRQNHMALADFLEGCADLSVAASSAIDGARVQGFATHWRESGHAPLRSPMRDREIREIENELRELLGSEAYDREYELGKRLAPEQALAVARDIAETLADQPPASP